MVPYYLSAHGFLPAEPNSQSQPMNLGDRIKKLLGIAEWADLLVEGDEPYFGF